MRQSVSDPLRLRVALLPEQVDLFQERMIEQSRNTAVHNSPHRTLAAYFELNC